MCMDGGVEWGLPYCFCSRFRSVKNNRKGFTFHCHSHPNTHAYIHSSKTNTKIRHKKSSKINSDSPVPIRKINTCTVAVVVVGDTNKYKYYIKVKMNNRLIPSMMSLCPLFSSAVRSPIFPVFIYFSLPLTNTNHFLL